MCLPIPLPAHVFFTIMKFHNNEIHSNVRTPILTPIKRHNKLKLEIPIELTCVYHARLV